MPKPGFYKKFYSPADTGANSGQTSKQKAKKTQEELPSVIGEPGKTNRKLHQSNHAAVNLMDEAISSKEGISIAEQRVRGMKEAFQAVLKGAELKDALKILSNLVIEQYKGQVRTAFYIFINEAENENLFSVRGGGNMPGAYEDEIDGLLAGEDALICGLAIPSGKPILTADVFTDPLFKPWEYVAKEFGYRAFWSFPVKTVCDNAMGTLAMYFENPREATPADVVLVDLVTQAAAVIISYFGEALKRKEIENALRESEQKFRTLFQTMREGLLVSELIRDENGKAVDFRFLEINNSHEKINGTPAHEVVGKTAKEIYFQFSDLVIDTYERVVKTGEQARFDWHIKELDKWYSILAFPLGGERFGVLYDDITGRKKNEEALREREERKTFLLKLNDTIRHLSEADEIQEISCRLLGEYLQVNRVHFADIIDDHFIIRKGYANQVKPFIKRGLLSTFGQHMLESYRRGETVAIDDVQTDSRFSEAEREKFQMLEIAAFAGTMQIQNGRWVSSLGIHNATPRIWTEAELVLLTDAGERIWLAVERARAREILERQVNERTEALHLSLGKLNKLNKELEEKNEELTSFAFIASHDLKEPMRKVAIFSDLILQRNPGLPDAARSYIKHIQASVLKMSVLIEDMLALSRLQVMKSITHNVDLNEVLKLSIEELNFQVTETGAKIDSPILPVIDGAQQPLVYLFNNLIDNAIKFKNENKATHIIISTAYLKGEDIGHPKAKAGQEYLKLTFKDNGIGFEKIYQDRIFEIFQRLNTEIPGTGIGLAICKKIMDNHFGFITAQSEYGQGAEFCCYFPVASELIHQKPG